MSFLRFYQKEQEREPVHDPNLTLTRSDLVQEINSKKHIDILVVGGGIHGAAFARVSALHGLRVLLLERSDYGFETSSRSSRMAHGGLRYLETLDLKQIIEGVRAREELLRMAPHLAKPQEFFLPVFENETFLRHKLSWGLKFYDLLVAKSQRHSWHTGWPYRAVTPPSLRSVQGGFLYFDGLMNDARIVLENILAARQEGAHCLNYANVESMTEQKDGSMRVGWRDRLSGKSHEIIAGAVINCAGAWAPQVGRLRRSELASDLCFSRGVHLIFKKAWSGPAMLRYSRKGEGHYFIWPHIAGTMLGPSENEVECAQSDPLPQPSEVDELIARVALDFPEFELNRSSLHYAYAGVRTMVRRGRRKDARDLSRRHEWVFDGRMLTLMGGKFTTAAHTSQEGFERLVRMSGAKITLGRLQDRPLPGAGPDLSKTLAMFEERAAEKGIPAAVCQRVIAQLGARLRFFAEEADFELIGGQLLAGELRLAFELDQAETLDDLLRRRLQIDWNEDYGEAALEGIIRYLARYKPNLKIEQELNARQQRLEKLRALLIS